jgi:hypothetical protein
MEKLKLFGIGRRFGALVILGFCAGTAFGQDVVRQDSVSTQPAGIFQLLKPSCMPCHSNEGRDKPRNAVNFSVWEQYTTMEKMMLASSIQKEVQKRSMPPKGFLNSHPGAVLDSLQIIRLVQWCDSLKSKP